MQLPEVAAALARRLDVLLLPVLLHVVVRLRLLVAAGQLLLDQVPDGRLIQLLARALWRFALGVSCEREFVCARVCARVRLHVCACAHSPCSGLHEVCVPWRSMQKSPRMTPNTTTCAGE